jgi:hypothetical protein
MDWCEMLALLLDVATGVMAVADMYAFFPFCMNGGLQNSLFKLS